MVEFGRLLLFPSAAELKLQREWTLREAERVGSVELELLALRATRQFGYAYAPYSNFFVGAAVLADSGEIYSGNNAEIAIFTSTIHAEQLAIAKAISEGEIKEGNRKFITALAVTLNSEDVSMPCGLCRQSILEHCDNALVLAVNKYSEIKAISSVRALLPFAFTPSALGK